MLHDVNGLISSFQKTSGHEWVLTDTRHVNDVCNSDDELLRSLDKLSNVILVSPEGDNLSTEIDLLSEQ